MKPIIEAITPQELEKILKLAKTHPYKTPNLLREREYGIVRPLLLSPQGAFLLMVDAGRGDTILGHGDKKTAYFAIDIQTGARSVVGVSSRPLEKEAALLEQFRGIPEFLQLRVSLHLEGASYIITEYCDRGELMHELVKRSLSVEETLKIALDIARGVAKLHALNYLHRDLKPHNIFLCNTPLRAVIGDFDSTCKANDQEGLKEILGNPFWIAPEKARLIAGNQAMTPLWAQATTFAEDIWTFGLLLFNLFRGGVLSWQKNPSNGPLSEVLFAQTAQIEETAVMREIGVSRLPKPLTPLLQLMLQVDPKKRPSAAVVYQYLSHLRVDQ